MEIFSWCASDSYRFECIDRTPRTPPINGKFSFAAVAQSSGGNFWQFLRVNFRINLISRVNLIRIRLNFISFDSSLHALSKVFWVQVDWTKHSAAKSRKTWNWRKMARTTRYIFASWRPTVSSNGVALKSKVVARSNSYRLVSNTLTFIHYLRQIRRWTTRRLLFDDSNEWKKKLFEGKNPTSCPLPSEGWPTWTLTDPAGVGEVITAVIFCSTSVQSASTADPWNVGHLPFHRSTVKKANYLIVDRTSQLITFICIVLIFKLKRKTFNSIPIESGHVTGVLSFHWLF